MSVYVCPVAELTMCTSVMLAGVVSGSDFWRGIRWHGVRGGRQPLCVPGSLRWSATSSSLLLLPLSAARPRSTPAELALVMDLPGRTAGSLLAVKASTIVCTAFQHDHGGVQLTAVSKCCRQLQLNLIGPSKRLQASQETPTTCKKVLAASHSLGL